MKSRRAELEASRRQTFGDLAPVYEAMQTCLAWNTIFEPSKARVVTPVSRVWNAGHWGGYVLFCWDTYFAAYMAAVDNKDLAYANAIEMTREKTASGFVPNFAAAGNVCARDRSQPPVGSLVVRELYRRFGDRWFIEEVFEDLLEWNRWWPAERSHDGLLCWGSTPYENMSDNKLEIAGVGNRQGAAYESGLDDSPMYDDVPYDPESHLMCLADAGLSGLYLMDCACLADIANALGRHSEADELRTRGTRDRGHTGRALGRGLRPLPQPADGYGRTEPENLTDEFLPYAVGRRDAGPGGAHGSRAPLQSRGVLGRLGYCRPSHAMIRPTIPSTGVGRSGRRRTSSSTLAFAITACRRLAPTWPPVRYGYSWRNGTGTGMSTRTMTPKPDMGRRRPTTIGEAC